MIARFGQFIIAEKKNTMNEADNDDDNDDYPNLNSCMNDETVILLSLNNRPCDRSTTA